MLKTKEKKANTRIQITGLLTIKQRGRVLAKDIPNHFVDQGLKGIITTIIAGNIRSYDGYWAYWRLFAYSWNIYLGSDTATPTTTTMTSLVSPIGTAPGTAPNSKSIAVKDGSTDGIWRATFIATWNAGTVSGTVGELALYGRLPDNATFRWSLVNTEHPTSTLMGSRLSSADGDFSSFIIDNTVPLTVEWKVEFSFV